MTFENPLSPPQAPSQPEQHTTPEQVSGTVGERQHQPLPQPAVEPSAPPSVAPELLPHNQNGTGGFAVPAPPPNLPEASDGLCPPPSMSREHNVPERVQPNGTANSQLSPDPTAQYMRQQPAPEPDALHVPGRP